MWRIIQIVAMIVGFINYRGNVELTDIMLLLIMYASTSVIVGVIRYVVSLFGLTSPSAREYGMSRAGSMIKSGVLTGLLFYATRLFS